MCTHDLFSFKNDRTVDLLFYIAAILPLIEICAGYNVRIMLCRILRKDLNRLFIDPIVAVQQQDIFS